MNATAYTLIRITGKCISLRKCGECCSAKWGWKYFLIKPNRLRHKETLNGFNQVKGFEQKSKSLNRANNVKMHTI